MATSMGSSSLIALLAGCGRIGFDPSSDSRATVDVPSCVAATSPTNWAAWPMPNDVGSGLPNIATLEPSSDGTVVVDRITHLVWQREPAPSIVAFADANAYCSTLVLHGCSSWRAPELIELESIVDHAELAAKIDPSAFPTTPIDQWWWSATAQDASNAWVVNFTNGNVFAAPDGTASHIRCVESGSAGLAPPDRYRVATATVLDLQTGLTWQRVADPGNYDQPGAVAFCASLALDGGGWRVPAIGELESIINPELSPTLDPIAFPSAPPSSYWTSSPLQPNEGTDWMIVHFSDGTVINDTVTNPDAVRCVR